MLPKMPAIEGLDLFAHYAPCEAVGGDFYDFVPVSPWEIGIVLGDVAGHGVDAALTMAVAKKTMQIHGMGRSSPRETLLVTCADLAPDLPGNSFVTVFYGVLDLRTWKLTFASAGHTPPILYNPERMPPLQSVPAKGVVMGGAFLQAMEKSLTEQTVNLRKGDTLFLYTDGLSEAPNAGDEQFGEPRILQALEASREGGAREIVGSVIRDLEKFVAGNPPQDDLTLLALRIAGEPRAAARAPQNQRRRVWPTNLQPARSTFVGRGNELAQLQKWLHDEGSLVTVTGASGLGKSRLAEEAGRALLETLPGGVWLVDASAARDVEQLATVAARTLGVALTSVGSAAEAVGVTLDFRPPLLLILDNCEGGERFARPLLERWRADAPRARFLVTSRETMGMPGERLLELKPLGTPTSADEYEVLDDSEATSLFVARARESNPAFRVTPGSGPRIASIVRGLKGNPLAIELAAAQTSDLSPRQIDDELRRDRKTRRPTGKTRRPTGKTRQPVAGTDSRPVVEPDAADWAFERLTAAEQLAFCQLSLMRGGFYLEAAEAVVKVAGGDVTTIVKSLLDKKLLQSGNTPYGVRFVLLPPLRSFGRRKRAEAFKPAQEDALTTRFIEYFAALSAAQAARFPTRHAREVMDRLEIDLDNILAGQDFALAMNRPELAATAMAGLSSVFDLRLPMMPRLDRITRVLGALPKKEVVLRARMHSLMADAVFFENKWEEALHNLSTAASLCRTAHEDKLLADTLLFSAFVMVRHSDFKAAHEAIDQAVAASRRAEYARGYERALVYTGIVTSQDRGAAEALTFYDRAEALIRKRDDLPALVECLNCKASALRALSRFPEALQYAQETARLVLRMNAPLAVAVQSNNIGQIHRAMGNFDDALEGYLQAEASLRDLGERLVLPRVLCNIAELYMFFDRTDEAVKYSREALALAIKDNDKQIQLRVQLIFGQLALAQQQYPQALASFEKALALARELGRPADSAQALAFASLCRTETGAARQTLADLTALQSQTPTLSEHRDALSFFVAACRARAEYKLGNRKAAAAALKDAQAQARLDHIDQYSSDALLHAAWGVVDELSAAGLADARTELTIRVRCTRCRAKVRGTERQVADLVACPVCKKAPFAYKLDPRNK